MSQIFDIWNMYARVYLLVLGGAIAAMTIAATVFISSINTISKTQKPNKQRIFPNLRFENVFKILVILVCIVGIVAILKNPQLWAEDFIRSLQILSELLSGLIAPLVTILFVFAIGYLARDLCKDLYNWWRNRDKVQESEGETEPAILAEIEDYLFQNRHK